MKNSLLARLFAIVLLPCLALAQIGCTSTGTLTPTAQSAADKIQTALETVEHILQQANTGLQTAAPSVETILTLTHNQGDAAYVNNVVATTAAATPALTTLLSNVQTAIKASTTPAAQIAAVNAATSPAAISAIVAPISAAGAYYEPVKKDNAQVCSTSPKFRISSVIRPRYGWLCSDNVY